MRRRIIWGILLLFVVIQFIPFELPENDGELSGDLLLNNSVPDEVAEVLRVSCYDCHSNRTNYRWYAYIAPIKYLVAHDVEEGREHLNFSEWERMSKIERIEALDEIAEEVREGEMPLKKYYITHPKAILNDKNRKDLEAWAENFADITF